MFTRKGIWWWRVVPLAAKLPSQRLWALPVTGRERTAWMKTGLFVLRILEARGA